MAAPYSRRVAVVGSAQTQFRASWSGRQHVELISEAVTKALKGSGLDIADVDFVIDSGSDILDGRSISNCGFLGAMGAHHKEESRVEEDGLWSATYGVMKIAAGPAQVGLIVAYSKPSEGDVGAFYSSQCEPFYQRPVGFDHLAACGLQAQAYLNRHGRTLEDLLPLVHKDWANAAANPAVDVEDAPDIEDFLSSETVAAPLRRLEVSRPVDGAVAVLIASAEVAHRVCPDPVWITGIGTAMDQHAFAAREIDALPACGAAALGAYASAGIREPEDVALVETSASSVVGEAMVLEALRLTAAGQAATLAGEDAKIALNPSGGSLPADPIMATGLARLSEASLQLAGRVDYGPDSAQRAYVHGAGGVGMQNHCVYVLEV